MPCTTCNAFGVSSKGLSHVCEEQHQSLIVWIDWQRDSGPIFLPGTWLCFPWLCSSTLESLSVQVNSIYVQSTFDLALVVL